MPEIKHNFMKGKMNKDLDERLVPNGEYRDALNIQVSTSEGSDVGTVQNILGNSLISGQDFISEQAVCVGSIADEKNDKLYYFISDQLEKIRDRAFTNSAEWTATTGTSEDYTGIGVLIASNGSTSSQYGGFFQDFDLVDGKTYKLKATFSENDTAGTSSNVYFIGGNDWSTNTGNNSYRPFSHPSVVNGTVNHTFIFDQSQNNSQTSMRFYIELTNGNTNIKQVRLESLSLVLVSDIIIEYDSNTNSITPVFVDVAGDVLKFHKDNIITGINIIDDLLLWTDNENEPRKINIDRSKAGTDASGLIHTNLIVEDSDEGPIKEEHITVIRKSPTKSPNFTAKTHGRTGRIDGNIKNFSGNGAAVSIFHPAGNSFAPVVDGDEMWVGTNTGGGGGNPGEPLNLEAGDILRVYKGYGAPTLDTSTGLKETPIARLLIKEVHNSNTGQKQVSQAQNNFAPSQASANVVSFSHEAALRVSVASYVTHPPGSTNGEYYFELEQEQVGIFERKFPRFACRYKYEDNEYSSVGPFSEVVFFPGEFEYHPTKAYNKGMINNLKELTLKDFVVADIPADVVGIDLLYKNEFSPNIYVVKSINKGDREWDTTRQEYNKYVIKTENVYAQIPSSQLIRPWDNVPKTALAQEITGNRVVYGNYTQGYDLTGSEGGREYKITPVVNATLDERLVAPQASNPAQSVKSQRTYNVGVVYGDKYGRETPVFTNESAYQFIAKPSSAAANAIVASVETPHPDWAEYYKVYMKETSNEYYNLPMGRVYDAKDGNVWISFPSIDRNKVDEDTYLILKKGVGAFDVEDENGDHSGNKAVLDEARYKVVAIENEAPDYIKTEYTVLAEISNKITGASLFGGSLANDYLVELPAEGPFPGTTSFTIDKKWWEHTGAANHHCGMMPLTNDEGTGIWDTRRDNDIYVSFSNRFKVANVGWNQSPTNMSSKYRVTSIEVIDSEATAPGYGGHDLYRITLAETIPETEAWFTEYLAEGNQTQVSNYSYGGRLRPHFYKEEVKNKPEFDGRFFVKIIEDEVLAAALKVEEGTPEGGYILSGAINNLYHFQDGASGTTGQVASKTRLHWQTNLGGNYNDVWFIDETAFAGVQPANQNHPKYSVTISDTTIDLCDTDSPTAYANFNQGALIDWTNGSGPNSPYPNAGNWGYHAPYLEVVTRPWGTGASTGLGKLKGVHAATYDAVDLADDSLSGYTAPSASNVDADGNPTDALYLSLSYGGINPRPNPSNSIGTPPAGDNFTASHYRDYYWTAFVGNKNWGVGVSSNPDTSNQEDIVKNLGNGKMFRLRGDDTIYKILGVTKRRLYNYMGKIRWDDMGVLKEINPNQYHDDGFAYIGYLHHLGGYYGTYDAWGDATTSGSQSHLVNTIEPSDLNSYVYNENALNGAGSDPYLHWTGRHNQHRNITDPLNCRVNYLIKYEVVEDTGPATSLADNDSFDDMSTTSAERLEFVEEFSTTKVNVLTSYPAIFETEPKEDVGLDIYYEASGKKPTNVTSLNIHNLITIGAIMQIGVPGAEAVNEGVFVTGITKVDAYPNSWRIDLSHPNMASYYGVVGNDNEGTEIRFYNDDGSFAITNLQQVIQPGEGSFFISDDGTFYQKSNTGAPPNVLSSHIIVMMSNKIGLGWFNCWSFGNGVESNRIGDTYNKPYITNGVKASTTLLEDYKEERRKYGLIYSGIYNSTSGVNNLNQFIAAEKITKDINPIYGSIQKLHSRSSADGDLITLCEDRILKILANKDALYNADGNPQLIASNNVLGQAVPFGGEFGISKNPESFASESFRIYFTDKVRGAVMRLSKDGLTPISDHGMRDWFRDNLKLSTKLIGSHDDRQDEYNITLADRKTLGEEMLEGATLMDSTHWLSSASLSENYDGNGALITSSGTGGASYPTFGHAVDLVDGASYAGSIRLSEIDYGVSTFLYGYSGGNGSYRPFTISTANTTNGEHRFEFKFDQAANNNSTTMRLAIQIYQGGTYVRSARVLRASLKEIISDPITVSFKEDVKGWVSFKSFVLENALSVANDYYTTLNGKLYKHHVENTNRNNFYGVDYNSSVNVILNDSPGSVKSFHTLDYEGSQSRVEGVKTVTVGVDSLTGVNPNGFAQGLYFYFNTKSEMDDLLGYAWDDGVVSTNIKQYRGGTLIREGFIYLANTQTTFGFVGRWNQGSTVSDSSAAAAGDWEVGDIITTKSQEDSVNYFNMTPKDGWYVSGIETDKQEGNIHEFTEKEGKWFNYIKGVDSDITSETDFGAFDIQGIGILKEAITSGNVAAFEASNPGAIYGLSLGWDYWNNIMEFDNPINASLQIGDIIYYQQNINSLGGFSTVNPNDIVKFGQVTGITSNTITIDETVFPESPGGTPDPYHGAFIFFAKNHTINTSSLLGYFADVKFENNSTDKIELFSVGSEITESSK